MVIAKFPTQKKTERINSAENIYMGEQTTDETQGLPCWLWWCKGCSRCTNVSGGGGVTDLDDGSQHLTTSDPFPVIGHSTNLDLYV